jgi:hypothetical protein
MIESKTEEQINQCIRLLKDILGPDLLGVYLYGSSILGTIHPTLIFNMAIGYAKNLKAVLLSRGQLKKCPSLLC